MIKTIHSKPIDGPESGVVVAAIVTCVLHLGGFIILDPTDFGVAIGAALTPAVMLAVRLLSTVSKRVEAAVEGDEE
tara:strand:- start:9467 stop:9694 length:228 start_codon:yes stop_codon:yes gene_type:complete